MRKYPLSLEIVGHNYSLLLDMYVRYPKKNFTCVQIFNMKSDSNEDIHLAHTEPKIRPPEPLTDQRIAIVFQPMAWASPAHTKTNQWCGDRPGTLEV